MLSYRIQKEIMTHYSSQDLVALSFNYFITHVFNLADSSAQVLEPRVSVPLDPSSVHILECTVKIKYEYPLAYYLKKEFGIDYDVMTRDNYGSCIIFYISIDSWHKILLDLEFMTSDDWLLSDTQLTAIKGCLWKDGSSVRSDSMIDLRSVSSLMRIVDNEGEIHEIETSDLISDVKKVERSGYTFNKRGSYNYLTVDEVVLFKKAYHDYIYNNHDDDSFITFLLNYL